MKKPTKPETSGKRYARGRRKLLQSLAVGGAAVTVKTMPEEWVKPALETAMIPVHAQGSPSVALALACEVDQPDLTSTVDLTYNKNPTSTPPSDFLFGSGGAEPTGTVDNIDPTPQADIPVTIRFADLQATVSPPTAGPISLGVSASGGLIDIDGGGNQLNVPVNGSGVATFGTVTAEFFTDNTGPQSSTVHFTYSAGGQNCQINVVFNENWNGAPPGP